MVFLGRWVLLHHKGTSGRRLGVFTLIFFCFLLQCSLPFWDSMVVKTLSLWARGLWGNPAQSMPKTFSFAVVGTELVLLGFYGGDGVERHRWSTNICSVPPPFFFGRNGTEIEEKRAFGTRAEKGRRCSILLILLELGLNPQGGSGPPGMPAEPSPACSAESMPSLCSAKEAFALLGSCPEPV